MSNILNDLSSYYKNLQDTFEKYNLLGNLLNNEDTELKKKTNDVYAIVSKLELEVINKNFTLTKGYLNKLAGLGIDSNIISDLDTFISNLELSNLDYKKEADVTTEDNNLILNKISDLIVNHYNDISSQININNQILLKNESVNNQEILSEIKEELFLIKAKIEPIEKSIIAVNNTHHQVLGNEIFNIKELITNLNTSISEIKSPSFPKEILDKLSYFCDNINKDKEKLKILTDDITNLEPNINNISNELKTISTSISKSLNEINNEYFEATKTHKENTINNITEIQKSTIATVKLISSDLPDKVSKMIGKTLWGNYFFFCLIFFTLVLGANVLMGLKVGHTISGDIFTEIRNNHASEQKPDPKITKSKSAH